MLLPLLLAAAAATTPPAPALANYSVAVAGDAGEHAAGPGPAVFAAHQLAHFIGLAADRGAPLPVVSLAELAPGQPAFVVGAEAAVA